MYNQWIRRSAGGAGLLAAAWLTVAATGSAADDKGQLPPAVAKGMVEKDIAFLQKGLSKTPEKRAVPTLKATAMLIALYAQDNQQGGLRDQALKVAEAIAKKDYAGAKAAADGLKAAPGGGSGGAVKLADQAKFDIAELMSTFRNATVGGRNMEKDIRAQAKSVTDPTLVGEMAARTVLICQYAHQMPAEKASANPANLKKWAGYTDDTAKLAREIADEAAKGAGANKGVLSKKLKALDASCTACHNDFRD